MQSRLPNRLCEIRSTPVFFPLALSFVLGLVLGGQVRAQTFTSLHSFSGGSGGGEPVCTPVLSGGALYGTTRQGGSGGNGTVFKVNTDGTDFTILHAFGPVQSSWDGIPSDVTNSDGAFPYAGVVLVGNTLYGTTASGGSSAGGTVFAVNTDGTGFTVVHTFDDVTDSGHPRGDLVVSGNTLYGTTLGGSGDDGTVFSVNTDGSGFTTLYWFSGQDDGAMPITGLALSSNTLYGTTYLSYAPGVSGGVFSLNTDGTRFTILHSFTGPDGANPAGTLVLDGTTLYGTTQTGGDASNGTVFKMNTDGTGFTTLHSFTAMSTNSPAGRNQDGAEPHAALIVLNKTLYGGTWFGGASGRGTLFAVQSDGTGFTTLHSFSAARDGANPLGGLVSSGFDLYGTSSSYSGTKLGTVFSMSFQPQLKINASGTSVTLTWPTGYAGFDYSGFKLQSAAQLLSPSWTADLPSPNVLNGHNTVTIPASGTQHLYKLVQ